MKVWTLETAYQDDIFGVMPVALIPQFLASLRKHGQSQGLSFDNVAKNLVYIPKQFLRMANRTEHLARLWQYDPGQVHLITDESIGSVARGAKSLQQQGTLGDGPSS